MKFEKRILAGTAMLGLGESIGQVANFVFVILFARSFGSELLGHYSLALSIGAIACLFVSLGAHGLITREIGQSPACGQQLVKRWLPFELGSALVVWIILAAVAGFMPVDAQMRRILVIIGAYQVIWHVGGLFMLQYSARGLMGVPALLSAGHRLTILLSAAALIALHADPVTALLAFPVVALLAVCLIAARARKAFEAEAADSQAPAVRTILADSRVFLWMTILAVIQIRAGIILMAMLGGASATGIYAAADRLIMPVFMIEGLLVSAAYPALLALSTTDRAAMQAVAARCVRLMLLFSISVAGLIFIFRRDIVTLTFGSGFAEAAAVLAILAWLPVMQGLRALLDAQAITAHLHAAATRIRAAVIALLICGAWLLIKSHGPAGLAVAVVGAELAHVAMLFALLTRHDLAPAITGHVFAPIGAIVFAGLAIGALGDAALLARLLVATVLTLAGLWLFGGIRPQDIRYLTAVLRAPASVTR